MGRPTKWERQRHPGDLLALPSGFCDSAPSEQSCCCLLTHGYSARGWACGFLMYTGPLLSLPSLQREAESENQRGLTAGSSRALAHCRAPRPGGQWPLLGLLAPRAPGADSSCQRCWCRSLSPLHPGPQLWHSASAASLLSHGVVTRKSQEVRRPHTSSILGRNPIPNCFAYYLTVLWERDT